jgi:hypothetical protein
MTPPGLHDSGAGNETRTRDPNLGKVVLYQLSYSRGEAAYFKGTPCRVNLHRPLCVNST